MMSMSPADCYNRLLQPSTGIATSSSKTPVQNFLDSDMNSLWPSTIVRFYQIIETLVSPLDHEDE